MAVAITGEAIMTTITTTPTQVSTRGLVPLSD